MYYMKIVHYKKDTLATDGKWAYLNLASEIQEVMPFSQKKKTRNVVVHLYLVVLGTL